jgi:hypothetical protein
MMFLELTAYDKKGASIKARVAHNSKNALNPLTTLDFFTCFLGKSLGLIVGVLSFVVVIFFGFATTFLCGLFFDKNTG